MDASDWIALVAVAIALGSALFAWGSWREAKRSADASVRSAKAAEEANVIQRQGQGFDLERQRQALSAKIHVELASRYQSDFDAGLALTIENRGHHAASDTTLVVIAGNQRSTMNGVRVLQPFGEPYTPSMPLTWVHPGVDPQGQGGGRPLPILPKQTLQVEVHYTDGNGPMVYQREMIWEEGPLMSRHVHWGEPVVRQESEL